MSVRTPDMPGSDHETDRRINLDAIPQPLKPNKITYTFSLEEVNRMLARQLGVSVAAITCNWNVTECRDHFDRPSGGYQITSVDVKVKQ